MIRSTFYKSISRHAFRASAHWNMVINITDRILTTSSWAWIFAFIVNASLISWTFIVNYTFRPTTSVWVSLIFWQASADTIVTQCVWATWGRITWVYIWYFYIWKITRLEMYPYISIKLIFTWVNVIKY